jgi:hypothetical protein
MNKKTRNARKKHRKAVDRTKAKRKVQMDRKKTV